jgi:hypothetical protein
MPKNKADEILKTLSQANRGGFYESLDEEQLKLFHDLVDVWINTPEEIHSRSWERVAKTFGPPLGRQRLATSTLRRTVTEIADGKRQRREK